MGDMGVVVKGNKANLTVTMGGTLIATGAPISKHLVAEMANLARPSTENSVFRAPFNRAEH
jgi:hypothetical protein